MEKRTELFLELGRLRGIEKLQDPAAVDYCRTGQYIRVAVDDSEKSLSEFVELASESQSFYRSVSLKQWLRTAISKDQEKDGQVIVHSNVVPRQAYLDAFCPGSHRCRGFSPASGVPDGVGDSSPRSCANCALAQQMKTERMSDMKVDDSNTLLEIMGVKYLQELAPSVDKVLWNCGTFVRKKFNCEGSLNRELLVAAEVLHPNIVHCFGLSLAVEFHDCQDEFDDDSDDDSFDGDMYMEWLDVDLQRFLIENGDGSESPFLYRDVLDVLLQVAEGMKHLHEKNFVHMDLKTHNIFMSCFELAHSGVKYYLVKVGDFGCAQRVYAPGETGEPFRACIGTTKYTAPEVFRCLKGQIAPPLTHPQKIDVYSFGVVAFQVLTGVANLYVNCFKIQEAVLGGRRPHTDFEGTLDDDRASLLTFVKRCWDEDPEQRPTFSEICEELKRRSNELRPRREEVLGKRKHHDLPGDDPVLVRLTKTAQPAQWAGTCSHERALCDANGII